MKTRKITGILAAATLALSMALGGCSGVTDSEDAAPQTATAGQPKVVFSIAGMARTALPEVDFASCTYSVKVTPQVGESGYKLGSDSEGVAYTTLTSASGAFALDAGTYTFEVAAFNSDAKKIMLAQAEDVKIESGEESVALSFYAGDEGEGSYEITVQYPANKGVELVAFALSDSAASVAEGADWNIANIIGTTENVTNTEGTITGTTFTLTVDADGYASASTTAEGAGAQVIDAGVTQFVHFKLYDTAAGDDGEIPEGATELGSFVESVYAVRGLTSKSTVKKELEQFIATVNVTLDGNAWADATLTAGKNDTKIEAVSDSAGTYTAVLPAGTYTVYAHGVEQKDAKVSSVAGSPAQADVAYYSVTLSTAVDTDAGITVESAEFAESFDGVLKSDTDKNVAYVPNGGAVGFTYKVKKGENVASEGYAVIATSGSLPTDVTEISKENSSETYTVTGTTTVTAKKEAEALTISSNADGSELTSAQLIGAYSVTKEATGAAGTATAILLNGGSGKKAFSATKGTSKADVTVDDVTYRFVAAETVTESDTIALAVLTVTKSENQETVAHATLTSALNSVALASAFGTDYSVTVSSITADNARSVYYGEDFESITTDDDAKALFYNNTNNITVDVKTDDTTYGTYPTFTVTNNRGVTLNQPLNAPDATADNTTVSYVVEFDCALAVGNMVERSSEEIALGIGDMPTTFSDAETADASCAFKVRGDKPVDTTNSVTEGAKLIAAVNVKMDFTTPGYKDESGEAVAYMLPNMVWCHYTINITATYGEAGNTYAATATIKNLTTEEDVMSGTIDCKGTPTYLHIIVPRGGTGNNAAYLDNVFVLSK